MRSLFLFYFSVMVASGVSDAAWGAKLSRVRGEARNEASHSGDADDDDEASSKKTGKLAAVRHEVREDRPSRGHGRHGGSSGHGHHHHCHGGGFLFFPVTRYEPAAVSTTYVERYVYPAGVEPGEVPTVPSGVPPQQGEFEYLPPSTMFCRQFPDYPYADGQAGCLVEQPIGEGNEWAGRIEFELGSDFDGVDRTAAGFFVEGLHGWGLDFNWASYSESLPGGGHDELHVGDFNVMHRIAETPHSMLRVGLGVSWLGDRYGSDLGINLTLKGDYMPFRPLVVSGEIDLGTLGDSEMLHGAATMGFMIGRGEVYGGYDYLRVGGAEIQGPTVGFRVWF